MSPAVELAAKNLVRAVEQDISLSYAGKKAIKDSIQIWQNCFGETT